jgi:hypothetical protein
MDLLEEKKNRKVQYVFHTKCIFNEFGNEFTNLDLCAKGSINSYNIFYKNHIYKWNMSDRRRLGWPGCKNFKGFLK